MPTKSVEVRLASRPQGEPTRDNFAFATVDLPDPKPGEVLVRNVCMSVDPYMRGRMNEGRSYVPPFQIGQTLEGGAVGRVVSSLDQKLPAGTFVQSIYGWREAFVAPASSLKAVDTSVAPPSAYLGILGVTGLTAWVGLLRIAGLKHGETVFISGGAGAVGSAACQFAKMHGCKVLASASSEQKFAFLRDELKVDYAFSYRDGEPLEHLKKGAPQGIDVYFDNTGGPQLEAALAALRNFGRVVMCGVFDLLVGAPLPGTATLCAMGLTTGGRWAQARMALHYLALLETLRSGTPPFRVALLHSGVGRYGVEDVLEEHLRAVVSHVVARLTRLARIGPEGGIDG